MGLSIIKSVSHEITKVHLNEKGKAFENHISIIVEATEVGFLALVMKPPKLFNELNEELVDKKYKDAIPKEIPAAYSVGKLRFEYILGDGNSYLKDGFKFIINYKNSNGLYLEETYIYSNEKWEREM